MAPLVLDRQPFQVLPCERISVPGRQVVEGRMHQARQLAPLIFVLRIVARQRGDRVEHGARLSRIVRKRHGRHPSRPLAPRADLVAAEYAQPGEQRRLPAIGRDLRQRPDQRRLRHLFGGILVAAEPHPCKPVDAREVLREEPIERLFVPGRQPPRQLEVR